MTYSYIIAVDQGTHSTRAIIYDANGIDIFHSKKPIDLSYTEKHHVEQDGLSILESCQYVLDEAHHYIQQHHLTNVAVALTTQRSTVIGWDSTSGSPLSPALSWLDTRAQNELDELNLDAHDIKARTGLQITAHYGASKLQWLLTHNGNVRDDLHNDSLLLGPLASFLIFNLVENNPALVDYANAHRTLLWNINTHDWDDDLLTTFSIHRNHLPIPVANTHDYGNLKGYGYPLILVNGDQNSALYAYANLQKETAFVNIGTGGFVIARSQQHIHSHSHLLFSITYSDSDEHEYAMEGTINGAGASLTWAEDTWGINDFQSVPWKDVTDVPIFINSVGGLGSPWWKSNISPYFLDSNKTFADYSNQQCKAALMESIIFLIANNLDEMLKLSIQPKKLLVSGGMSADTYLCQRLADICSLPVSISNYKETTSRGAAWLAFGRPDWELAGSHTLQPRQDQALTMRYQQFTQAIKQHQRIHRLIAHRGDMTRYPENSLTAIQAALSLGFSNIEIDIQLSKDCMPMVIHDDNLVRTTGVNKNVRDLTATELSHYTLTNEHQFTHDQTVSHIPTLDAVVTTLNNHPEITLFVEIKRQSIEYFGLHKVVDSVLHPLALAKFHVVVISFISDVISLVQSKHLYPVGWVIREFDHTHQQCAEQLQPDYLFCNIDKIDSPSNLWEGSWKWVLYDIENPSHACVLLNQGVDLIETGDIEKLANDHEFN